MWGVTKGGRVKSQSLPVWWLNFLRVISTCVGNFKVLIWNVASFKKNSTTETHSREEPFDSAKSPVYTGSEAFIRSVIEVGLVLP